jgi:hypothetical protein
MAVGADRGRSRAPHRRGLGALEDNLFLQHGGAGEEALSLAFANVFSWDFDLHPEPTGRRFAWSSRSSTARASSWATVTSRRALRFEIGGERVFSAFLYGDPAGRDY